MQPSYEAALPCRRRYILPQFEERTSYGMKRLDPYTKMFEDRIIFLGVQVDDASADDIIAQLIVLESQDPDRDILMYINSPGGSFTAMTAIYDTMQYIRPDIQTFVVGQAASAAAVLTAAGAKGKRFALPNARILIHQPALGGGDYGQASDIEIQANEVLRMRTWLEETLAGHTGRTPEQVNEDIERDKIMSAAEAKEYGLIDEVLLSRKGSLDSLTAAARLARSPSNSPIGAQRPEFRTLRTSLSRLRRARGDGRAPSRSRSSAKDWARNVPDSQRPRAARARHPRSDGSTDIGRTADCPPRAEPANGECDAPRSTRVIGADRGSDR